MLDMIYDLSDKTWDNSLTSEAIGEIGNLVGVFVDILDVAYKYCVVFLN